MHIPLPLACLLAGLGAGLVASPAQAPSVADLLNRYVQRDPSVAAALASVQNSDAARVELGKLAPKFLSGDKNRSEERRRWLVTFTLELAQAHSERESVSAGLLVEWACRYVRRHEPVSEFDRRWQHAATALLEGAINPTALDGHLRHIGGQFPKEPWFALARAFVSEQQTAPREVLARSRLAPAGRPNAPDKMPPIRAFQEEAARRFQEVSLGVERLRAEANVRRARVHISLARHEDALLALDGVERQTKDPALVYLSHLFRGLALEGLGRKDEAREAWMSALRIGPGAQSALMALATSLFQERRRAEADMLIGGMLEHNDPRVDPWWSYWAGDYRLWYPLIAAVRELL